MRERIFSKVPPEWNAAYASGVFTEFMEQRAPGHTTLDGKIYQKGLKDFKEEIAAAAKRLDFLNDPGATDRREQLIAMDITCDAAIIFAYETADNLISCDHAHAVAVVHNTLVIAYQTANAALRAGYIHIFYSQVPHLGS